MIDRLGHYHLLERIGAGGMGDVYRARDTKLGRTTAIKLLPPEVAADPERRERFLREARVAAALSHPNIATLFEIGEDGPHLFLVFEYVRGDTLRAVIGGRPLPVRRALDLGVQIADALAEAHAQGVVHRDIKPDNVMVTSSDRAKILDFGLATWTTGGIVRADRDATQFTTTPGMLLGTLAYMAPEQAQGLPVDHRADIFALGAVLYEMLTGRPAFAEATPTATLLRVVQASPPPPSALNRGVPPELDALVLRALDKHPDARHRSAAVLAAELRSVGLMLDLRRGSAEPPMPAPSRRAARAGRWVAAVVMTVLLGSAGWFWGRDEARRLWHRWLGPAPSPVVAVMPFESDSPDQAYFADGLTEDLITRLGQIPGLRVVGRSAIRAYRGKDVREVARELGAGTVMTGSVRRESDQVRVTVELADPVSGVQIWSGQYTRAVVQVFAVQTQIAEAVARELRLALEPSPARVRGASRLVDARAYDLYLAGRAAAARRELALAISQYERAIAIDQGLAEAQAGLAEVLYLQSEWTGAFGDPAISARIREAAESAAQTDPDLPQVQLALALAAPALADTLKHLRRSIEIDPTFAEGHHQVGDQIIGFDPLQAIRFYRRSLELDPRLEANRIAAANAYLLLGRPGDAEQEVKASTALTLNQFWHKDVLAHVEYHRGRYDAGLAIVAGDPRIEGDAYAWLDYVAASYAAGKVDTALAAAVSLTERYPASCAARAVLAGLRVDTGQRAGGRQAAEGIIADAGHPDAPAGAWRCAVLAAAATKDPEQTAFWLRRVAGDEAALRQWALVASLSATERLDPRWFPWASVASHPSVVAAAKELNEARERLKLVVAQVLAGLP